jgi:Na+-transporting methylmalonyl-CoA/oxaloacetate decarboxylase gamma subunit
MVQRRRVSTAISLYKESLMNANLINALLVTAIGMGLVFASIVLLWGMMAALVRIASNQPKETDADSIAAGATTNILVNPLDRKKKAAAIAVSIALAQQADQDEPHEFPLPPTPLVSAWQAVMRTKMLSKRGTTR